MLMAIWGAAALLLGINALVFAIGIVLSGSSAGIDRPAWLPPSWIRAAVPVVVAAGLWLGHRWAWWVGVVMCVALLLWTGLASLVLGFGGYFAGEGATWGTVHLGMLVATWLTVLALLLSPAARAV